MPSEERKSFLLRIAPDLWKDLESWSADELRSVNGQIEFILREAIKKRKKVAAQPAPIPETTLPNVDPGPK